MTSTPSPENEAPRERTSTATPTVIPPEVKVVEFAVAKLALKPGEVLLVKVPDINAREGYQIQEQLGVVLADLGVTNGVVVVPVDWQFEVVAP